MTTDAPWRASERAVAAPIPLLPPVTMATLPAISPGWTRVGSRVVRVIADAPFGSRVGPGRARSERRAWWSRAGSAGWPEAMGRPALTGRTGRRTVRPDGRVARVARVARRDRTVVAADPALDPAGRRGAARGLVPLGRGRHGRRDDRYRSRRTDGGDRPDLVARPDRLRLPLPPRTPTRVAPAPPSDDPLDRAGDDQVFPGF